MRLPVSRRLRLMTWVLGLPQPAPARQAIAADLVPFARDLRRILGADRLWLRIAPPSGGAWVEVSGTAGDRPPELHDALERLGRPPGRPASIPRHALPDGWRAGVRVPLRTSDGPDTGCLLLGWTRRSGRYRASRTTSGTLGETVTAVARTLGAFWADAWTVHELEAERSRISAVIDHCGAAVLAVQGGRVVLWNATMAALAGVPAEGAVGRPVAELFTLTTEDGDAVDLAGVPRGNVRLTTPGGRSLWVRVSCSAPPDDAAPGLLTAVFVDESAQRQLEDMRHLLVTSIRHELYGPLTTIRGHAQLLEAVLPQDESAASSLGAILDAGEMMHRVVGDLGPLSGTDPAAPPATAAEPIGVAALVRRTLRSVPSVAARTAAAVPPGLTVRGDSVRLRQCLLVVLGNAEKYAPEGKIEITAHTDGASGVISIADQGPGIPAAERDLVLEPYYRSAVARPRPGAGLGLHIADVAMTAMHGRIELAAGPTCGLDVRLVLPLASGPHGDEDRTADDGAGTEVL